MSELAVTEYELRLPRHKANLSIEHNPHKGFYQPIESYIEENKASFSFRDEANKQKSIAKNELWIITWYPDTPIGSFSVASCSFFGALRYANEVQEGEDKTNEA